MYMYIYVYVGKDTGSVYICMCVCRRREGVLCTKGKGVEFEGCHGYRSDAFVLALWCSLGRWEMRQLQRKMREECFLIFFFDTWRKISILFVSKFEIKGSKWRQSTDAYVIELMESLGNDSVEWHQGKYHRGIVMVTDSPSVEPQSHLSGLVTLHWYGAWCLHTLPVCMSVHTCTCVSVCMCFCLCFSLLKSPHRLSIVPDYLIQHWEGFKPGSIWGLSVATGFILKSLLSPTKSQRLELICWLLPKYWSLKGCLETARRLSHSPFSSCSSSFLIASQICVY